MIGAFFACTGGLFAWIALADFPLATVSLFIPVVIFRLLFFKHSFPLCARPQLYFSADSIYISTQSAGNDFYYLFDNALLKKILLMRLFDYNCENFAILNILLFGFGVLSTKMLAPSHDLGIYFVYQENISSEIV